MNAVEDDRPVFLIENKLMYGRPNRRPEEGHIGELAVRETGARYPALTFSGTDFSEGAATIVTYGGMVPVVLDAVTELILEHEIFCEVVALSQLLPMELEPVLESVARTGALVTAEEGTLTGGFGAEIAARVQEAAWSDLRGPVQRVAARDGIIPSARPLEDAMLPSAPTSWRRSSRSKACEASAAARDRPDARGREHRVRAPRGVARRGPRGGRAGPAGLVVETTKATVEVEAPGAGTIVQLYEDGVEVELGKTIARIAESAEELASLEQEADEEKPAPKPAARSGRRRRRPLALAERHGVDLAEIDKRGFITEKDVEELVARQKAAAAPGRGPLSRASRPTA